MIRRKAKTLLLHICSAIMYGLLALEWMVAIIPYIFVFMNTDAYKAYISQQSQQLHIAPEQPSSPFIVGLAIIASAVLVVAVIRFTLRSLAKTPRAIEDTGQKLTDMAVTIVTPIVLPRRSVSQHKHHTAKKKVVIYTVLLLIVLPIIALLYAPSVQTRTGVANDVLLFLASGLGLGTVLLFCVRRILQPAFKR